MHENEIPLPPQPPRRGVFRAPASEGNVAFQAIAATGRKVAALELPRPAFDPLHILVLWNVLEVSDPLTEEQRLAALLRATWPRRRRRRRIRHT
jgi:hypothetical protein